MRSRTVSPTSGVSSGTAAAIAIILCIVGIIIGVVVGVYKDQIVKIIYRKHQTVQKKEDVMSFANSALTE